ncbi:MAG: DUF1993 domain-containing protein [Alphaproteobacteria bacterium]|nr:DUF1993 domain-containing protein [Alphaproteobacteria bacterium]
MTTVKRNLDIYRTRLKTLQNILGRAEAELLPVDPEKKALLTARLAPDMLPFPNQVWFTCRQAELLLGKLNETPVKEFETDTASFADLKKLVAETISRIEAQADTKEDFATGQTSLEIPGFPTLAISGQDYIDEWLTPNFYFHLVTAYDILRAQGLAIGKADYMSHLLPLLAGAAPS